jgi:hypothetical protein
MGLVLFGVGSEVDEQRGAPRFDTRCVVLVTNLSLKTKTIMGCLHDVCATGMRIETTLPVHVGNEVRVNLPSFLVVAEVVHYAVGTHRYDFGLKLARPLNAEELDQCIQPDRWAKTLLRDSRRSRVAPFVFR